jgi:CHAD domain-containing protein
MSGELEHVQKALRELGKSLKGLPPNPLPKQVHKLRTSARRVEAIAVALPQAEGKASRRLVKAIEPLRKAAGGVRDMDVLTANIRRLRQSAPADSLARLVDHLDAARADEASQLRMALERKRETARENLKAYSRKVESTLAANGAVSNGHQQNGHHHNGHRRNGMNPTARRLAREIAEWPPVDSSNIHQFRLRIKELRYILQLDSHADPELLASLGTVQRRIGEWHDWEQLGEIAHEFLTPAQDGVLLGQIDTTMHKKLGRALSAAKSLRREHLRTGISHVMGC